MPNSHEFFGSFFFLWPRDMPGPKPPKLPPALGKQFLLCASLILLRSLNIILLIGRRHPQLLMWVSGATILLQADAARMTSRCRA